MGADISQAQKRTGLRWQGLSLTDSNALKGFGILVIVIHNFLHVLPNWNIENEFAYDREKFDFFLRELNTDTLFTLTGLVFSYIGHYAVEIFIFLSAYGLYLSTRNKKIAYWKFIRDRVSKLYPAFFLAVLMMIALNIITTRRFDHYGLYYESALRLSLLSNLIPGKSFEIVGPWWFYSLIVQFYLVFPLLRNLFEKYGVKSLLILSAASYVLQLLFNDYLIDNYQLFLNTTIIGHIPVFAMGFILARYRDLPMPFWAFLLFCALFYLGNLNEAGWILTRNWAVAILLYVYLFVKRLRPSPVSVPARAILFYGTLSMFVFAVNGFLRHPFLQQLAKYPDNEWIRFGITLAFVLFVTLMALLLRAAEKYFLKLLSYSSRIYLPSKQKIGLEKK